MCENCVDYFFPQYKPYIKLEFVSSISITSATRTRRKRGTGNGNKTAAPVVRLKMSTVALRRPQNPATLISRLATLICSPPQRCSGLRW